MEWLRIVRWSSTRICPLRVLQTASQVPCFSICSNYFLPIFKPLDIFAFQVTSQEYWAIFLVVIHCHQMVSWKRKSRGLFEILPLTFFLPQGNRRRPRYRSLLKHQFVHEEHGDLVRTSGSKWVVLGRGWDSTVLSDDVYAVGSWVTFWVVPTSSKNQTINCWSWLATDLVDNGEVCYSSLSHLELLF